MDSLEANAKYEKCWGLRLKSVISVSCVSGLLVSQMSQSCHGADNTRGKQFNETRRKFYERHDATQSWPRDTTLLIVLDTGEDFQILIYL